MSLTVDVNPQIETQGKKQLPYDRILLKLSGEVFAGTTGFGVDAPTVRRYAQELADIVAMGVQIAVVVGGGNIWRGRMAPQMERATADQMGMIATVINAPLRSAASTTTVPRGSHDVSSTVHLI